MKLALLISVFITIGFSGLVSQAAGSGAAEYDVNASGSKKANTGDPTITEAGTVCEPGEKKCPMLVPGVRLSDEGKNAYRLDSTKPGKKPGSEKPKTRK